jgi:hypothetical protein
MSSVAPPIHQREANPTDRPSLESKTHPRRQLQRHVMCPTSSRPGQLTDTPIKEESSAAVRGCMGECDAAVRRMCVRPWRTSQGPWFLRFRFQTAIDVLAR